MANIKPRYHTSAFAKKKKILKKMNLLYSLVFLEPCNGTDIYGLCYWGITEKLTFLDANSKCGENNGTLAEIPNYNSNNFVSTNLWVKFVNLSKVTIIKEIYYTIIGHPSLVYISYDVLLFSKRIACLNVAFPLSLHFHISVKFKKKMLQLANWELRISEY